MTIRFYFFLGGGGEVGWAENIFTVPSSCLLSPIMVIIQSSIIYRDKICKKLELCFESKW